MKQPLIILTGPTAVGKTKLSIALAKMVGGEIISADSMQVYRHMDIGSAKITTEEMQGIPHHLINVLEPEEAFHVVKFQEMAREALQTIYANGHIPIVAGGTGFYIQALLYDIDFTKDGEDSDDRKQLELLAKENGPLYLHQMLRSVDEKSADAIHFNNVKRVIRALEFFQQTGTKISEHNETQRQKPSPYNFAYFVLNDDRAVLYDKINCRIEQMLEQGLVDEVRCLHERGCHKHMTSMQGLGYKEILSYLEGECNFEEAIHTLKRDTRHFAKRQLTWFKREREVMWLDKQDYNYNESGLAAAMQDELEKKGIILCQK